MKKSFILYFIILFKTLRLFLLIYEFPSLCYHHTIIDTFSHIDSAIIVTDWPELKDYFVNHKPSIPIIDGRGV